MIITSSKKNVKLDITKATVLSKSVIDKSSKVDIEEILNNHLYPKFGKRFTDYRTR